MNRLLAWIYTLLLIQLNYLIKAIPIIKYDEAEAKRMLSMSAAAYSTTPVSCLNQTFPFHEIWRIESGANTKCDLLKNTCSAFVAISDEKSEMIIAFRGTTTKLQLFVQTAYTLGPKEEFYAMGKVQRYFKDALEAIWSNVQPFLELADYKSYSISFTGHSLGGALASLAAVRTVKDGYRTSNQIKLITFGQPRVGDSTFAAMHDQLIPYSFRVVNKADLVPHLPPCKTTNDMCDPDPERKSAYHHGTEIWYSNGMGVNATYRVCAGLPFDEDNTCSNSLPDLSFKVDDHTHYFDQMVSQFGKSGCIDDD